MINKEDGVRKMIWLFVVGMLVSGCATTQWVHATKSREVFYQDKLTCEEMANRLAWQRYPQPPVAINTTVQVDNDDGTKGENRHEGTEDPHSYWRESYREDSLQDCLHSKGWQEVRGESSRE